MNRLTIAIFVEKGAPSIALVLAASLITAVVVGGASKPLNASTPNPNQTSSEKAQNMKITINTGGKSLPSHFGRQ
jgi:hypothetical protein